MRNNKKRPTRPEDLMHDAAVRGDHLHGEQPYDHGTGQGATPITGRADAVLERDRARREKLGGRAEKPSYQRGGLDVGAGYLNNPFDEAGRGRIGRQFWQAPLGGHARNFLEGQEIFGHTITAGQARTAEQGLAGLAAVGVGVPAFMAAVNQLSTPQTPDTIPMV